MYIHVYALCYRSEGVPERRMESLHMMGWGLVVVGSSSTVAASPGGTIGRGTIGCGIMLVVGCDG